MRSAKQGKCLGIHLAATDQMINERDTFITGVTLEYIDLLLTQFARLKKRTRQTGRSRR
jgi:hypothetical protein